MSHPQIPFHYALGEVVRYRGSEWRILFRRYTERLALGPIIEYGMSPILPHPCSPYIWAAEPDITRLEEDASHAPR